MTVKFSTVKSSLAGSSRCEGPLAAILSRMAQRSCGSFTMILRPWVSSLMNYWPINAMTFPFCPKKMKIYPFPCRIDFREGNMLTHFVLDYVRLCFRMACGLIRSLCDLVFNMLSGRCLLNDLLVKPIARLSTRHTRINKCEAKPHTSEKSFISWSFSNVRLHGF